MLVTKANLVIVFFVFSLASFYFLLIPFINISISSKCHSTWMCRRFLRPSYENFEVDQSDSQWREFRATIPILVLAATSTSIINFILRFYLKGRFQYITSYFYFIIGILHLVYLHRYHSIVVLVIACVGFLLGFITKRNSTWKHLIIWIYAVVIILLKESYRVKHLQYFQVLVPLFDYSKYGGIYRWQLSCNFLVLRMISFVMDDSCRDDTIMEDEQSLDKKTANSTIHSGHDILKSHDSMGKKIEEQSERRSEWCNRGYEDNTNHANSTDNHYDLMRYLGYCLYPPLYVAGPIVTFRDFVIATDAPRWESRYIFFYALRWIGSYALLEFFTHIFPYFAVINSGLFARLSPSEVPVVAYVVLLMMWLKFLLIWRLFRLWALLDGVYTVPENMTRCMSNNYSLSQFWRGWHASFNAWIVRYLYVPLGGRRHQMRNAVVVFFFVAIWHDIEPKLLVWAALNSVFYFTEAIGRYIYQRIAGHTSPTVLHALCTAAAASNIIALITLNMIGYSVGVGGAQAIAKFLSWDGFVALLISFGYMCVGYNIMVTIEYHRFSRSNEDALYRRSK